MAKTGYLTVWVPTAGADFDALRAQHQRCFPGNALSVVAGFVKVAVLDGETPPAGAVSEKPRIPVKDRLGV